MKTYDAEVLFKYTVVSVPPAHGHTFASDGSKLLVTSDETGVHNVYEIDIDSVQRTSRTYSTTGAHHAVSYFPQDERILFTADNEGDELNHLYVGERGGEVVDLTPGDSVKASFVRWANKGSGFFALTNEIDSRQMDLYRYDSETYERALVFRNEAALALMDISPDASTVVAGRPHSSDDSDLLLIDLRAHGGTPQLITPHNGVVNHRYYSFTPESSQLVYGTDENGEFMEAWIYDLASGERQPLFQQGWDVMYVGFSPSGRYRVWAVNEDASTRVHVDDVESGNEVELVGLPPGTIDSVRFSRDESRLAVLVSTDVAPPNVHLVDLLDGASARLTDVANPEVDDRDLVTSQVVRYESYDGLAIPGVLYKPQQAARMSPVGALVYVHGGPGGQSRTGYSAMIQHLVNHGYAVLAANNRGSSGYGKTFYRMDNRRHGEVDLDDIVRAKSYLASLDWVDGDRIGVMGGSYGGYMTVAALAFHPEVFKVGIDVFGPTNWVRTLKAIPAWWEQMRASLYDLMGDPFDEEQESRLRRISPLFHADRINKPMLVVQGANDPRVLQRESDEIVETVRANGVPVEYIVFDDEGHGFAKRGNRIAASNAFVAFLGDHL